MAETPKDDEPRPERFTVSDPTGLRYTPPSPVPGRSADDPAPNGPDTPAPSKP